MITKNLKNKILLEKFSKLTKELEKEKIFFITFGGFAVDGYVKKFTRNHQDVDLFCFRSDVQRVRNVLEKLGFENELFGLPQEPNFKYKIRTNGKDRIYTFHILDMKDKNKFEVSFYRFPHLLFPLKYIKPPQYLELENIKFPAVKKDLLIKLKKM